MGRQDISVTNFKNEYYENFSVSSINVLVANAMLLHAQFVDPNGLKRIEIVYTPKLLPGEQDIQKVLAGINESLKDGYQCITYIFENQKYSKIPADDITVFEDRIEYKLKNKTGILNFSQIISSAPCIRQNVVVYQNKDNNLVNDKPFIQVGNLITFEFYMYKYDMKLVKQFADNLFFFQHYLNVKQFDQQLTLFEPLATQYRVLDVKPEISEEQRKFIVQANLLNQQKKYEKAIELYLEAIELNQTAYPAAYSNLALLSAQITKFDAAIYYIKKYLMLVPDAEDARTAQDKIYEWKTKNGK